PRPRPPPAGAWPSWPTGTTPVSRPLDATKAPSPLRAPVPSVSVELAADRGADGGELAGSAPAQEGDGHDADDRDQRHEEGVLHEAGATLAVAELRPQVRGAMLLPVTDEVHSPIPFVSATPLAASGLDIGAGRRALM